MVNKIDELINALGLITLELAKEQVSDITISYTGEYEVLLYRKLDNKLLHIIIDEDGDVE